ncbi:MAG: hypothetical protein J6U23_08600 [Clostridiales bacterium]|nr:hypothetical protein [Clostridiales bacterium]
MLIEPKRGYKKPLYIAGLSVALSAAMLLGTACTDTPIESEAETEETGTTVISVVTAGFVCDLCHFL